MTNHEIPSPTAVWVDGDPLMEAIAAAVWEQCGRSDSGSCVEDDPRTIAAVAAAVSVPPPAPRADDQASATVLTKTQRDMLRYALDLAQEQMLCVGDEFSEDDHDAIDSLRRLAAEAQPTAEAHSCRNCEGIDPDTCLMNPDRPRDSRPRCPDCQMPHDLTPSVALACASIRASIADHHPAVSGPVAGEQQNETPEAEAPTTTKPAASPSVVDEVVAALQAKAQALSVEAEEEMRRDLEDQAQVWHEAADLARRTGRKAVRNAQPTAKPETDGEGAATRFNWSDIIPAPVDETAQERDRLIDCVNRVRVALNDCKERAATGMQYEIAVREAIGDREPRRGPGPLCHESDPRTLRECALKANHGGDHEDGDLAWPCQEHQPAAPADCNTGPAAGVRQDGAQP